MRIARDDGRVKMLCRLTSCCAAAVQVQPEAASGQQSGPSEEPPSGGRCIPLRLPAWDPPLQGIPRIPKGLLGSTVPHRQPPGGRSSSHWRQRLRVVIGPLSLQHSDSRGTAGDWCDAGVSLDGEQAQAGLRGDGRMLARAEGDGRAGSGQPYGGLLAHAPAPAAGVPRRACSCWQGRCCERG